MTKQRLRGAGKFAAISLALAAAVAMPLSASARGWSGHGGHYGGYHGSYHGSYYGGYHGGDRGYYGGRYRGGGYWHGGRWIAGALITGAVVGLVADALQPRPVYYGAPVYYGSPAYYGSPRVVYQDGPPVVRRRVVESRTVYEDPDQTRYVRDDGYDSDDGN